MANAPRSSGRTSINDPLLARPIGVRVAETMTASGIGILLGLIRRPFNARGGRARQSLRRAGVEARARQRTEKPRRIDALRALISLKSGAGDGTEVARERRVLRIHTERTEPLL